MDLAAVGELKKLARERFGKSVLSPWLARCVSKMLLAIPALARGLAPAARCWRWLTTSLFDPYRPERYYMRGPGPKSQKSHAGAAGG